MTLIIGKSASELEAIFEQQSQAIKENPGLKFERTVSYALVSCDTELKRIPLDARSIGLAVKASSDDPASLDEDFVFSLLLATGTLSHSTIDVPADSDVDPQLVLEEAEAQGLNVRVMLPDNPVSIEAVKGYVELLESYATLWLSQSSGNFALSPLDGYLEYKFQLALGYQAQQITTNPEMQQLYTDTVSDEVMDFIKGRLDVVIEKELGGEDYFRDHVANIGAALHLKQKELRDARRRMLEEELDYRTPVPNLIRATSKLTGLSIADAAGMIYEIKNSIHTVLDKYLPKREGEAADTPGAAQTDFASGIVSVLSAALGGNQQLLSAWDSISRATQLNKCIDVDRGVAEPAESAKRAAVQLEVDPKVAALAGAELAAFLGSILKAGGAIETIGIEKPTPLSEPAKSNIIAVG